jgi:hypothetical protein
MATKSSTEFNLVFDLEKETPGTFRYRERTDDSPVVGTLYVKKAALPNGAPKALTVTVNSVDA